MRFLILLQENAIIVYEIRKKNLWIMEICHCIRNVLFLWWHHPLQLLMKHYIFHQKISINFSQYKKGRFYLQSITLILATYLLLVTTSYLWWNATNVLFNLWCKQRRGNKKKWFIKKRKIVSHQIDLSTVHYRVIEHGMVWLIAGEVNWWFTSIIWNVSPSVYPYLEILYFLLKAILWTKIIMFTGCWFATKRASEYKQSWTFWKLWEK